MRIRFLPIVAAAVVLAGCSGGSDVPRVDAAPTTPSTVPVTTSTTPQISSATSTTNAPATTPATTLRPAAPTSTAAASVQQQLGNAVRAFFAAREAANAAPTPNPDFPQLVAVASGDALRAVRDETTKRKADGQAIRAGAQNLAQIKVGSVTVTDATAVVAACSIDDGVIFEVASGRVINDAVQTHNYRVDLEQVASSWNVTKVTRLQQWEGIAGCARSLADFPY